MGLGAVAFCDDGVFAGRAAATAGEGIADLVVGVIARWEGADRRLLVSCNGTGRLFRTWPVSDLALLICR